MTRPRSLLDQAEHQMHLAQRRRRRAESTLARTRQTIARTPSYNEGRRLAYNLGQLNVMTDQHHAAIAFYEGLRLPTLDLDAPTAGVHCFRCGEFVAFDSDAVAEIVDYRGDRKLVHWPGCREPGDQFV